MLSDKGWQSVKSFNITEKTVFYHIKTESRDLLCTKNHILIDEFGNEVFAVDSLNRKIKTRYGLKTVTSVE